MEDNPPFMASPTMRVARWPLLWTGQRGRFDYVIVCVNDTLQHTKPMFELGLSREAALDAAITGCKIVHYGNGRHRQSIPQLSKLFQIWLKQIME